MNGKKLIVLCGGQTGGPVAPLLALTTAFSANYILVDVPKSSGQALAQKYAVEFKPTFGGKAPRYLTWHWPVEILKILGSFAQAFWFMLRRRPALLIGAGGFTQVPWGLAAWLCRVPIVIHQQDVLPTWSNLILAKMASLVTVVFSESRQNFSGSTHVVTLGNPSVGTDVLADKTAWNFGSESKLNLLVVGGGGGAASINALVRRNLADLTKEFNVLHVYGNNQSETFLPSSGYKPVSFMTNFREVLECADLVISRAGLGAITDIIVARKPSLMLPIPQSHQVANAEWLKKFEVCKVINEVDVSNEEFMENLSALRQMKIGSELWQKVQLEFPVKGVIQRFWDLVAERSLV